MNAKEAPEYYQLVLNIPCVIHFFTSLITVGKSKCM